MLDGLEHYQCAHTRYTKRTHTHTKHCIVQCYADTQSNPHTLPLQCYADGYTAQSPHVAMCNDVQIAKAFSHTLPVQCYADGYSAQSPHVAMCSDVQRAKAFSHTLPLQCYADTGGHALRRIMVEMSLAHLVVPATVLMAAQVWWLYRPRSGRRSAGL